ncbi:DUF6193 family natural product biosynthesis protein [Streptosporangium sp. NPDC050280]|uniref:DUF6193 family natural product biosynthesis protein n=1 Tax=unclassified Streptosporangium TaxID=2632669 RepID=UPI003430A7DA
MPAGREIPDFGPADALNVNLYPDLVAKGGLALAIKRLSEEIRVDIPHVHTQPNSGRYTSAKVDSNRGVISVLLGVEKRIFSIKIASDTHVWASGGTEDLSKVIKVIFAWQNGSTLKELREEFPFMGYEKLAEAYEQGNPVPVQWDLLLKDRSYTNIGNLLRAVHSREELRTRFPYVSHGMLRLTESPFSRSPNEIWIAPLSTIGYQVEISGSPESRTECGTLEEAINAAIACLI